MTASLDGRTVLVTGAGAGVGRGIALACATVGATVVVTSRRDNGDETARAIRDRGGDATWVRCDVTDPNQVAAAVDVAVDQTGRLDAVVHNATSGRSSEPVRLADVTPDVWEDHASVSLRGSFFCARAAHPHLVATGGSLVLLTSPAAIEGAGELPLYGVVKAAQRGLVKALAQEWGADGVRVNALAPLAVSDALERAFAGDPDLQVRISDAVPLGRIGDPEHDIGPTAVFLVGPDARYVTGQTLVVSGGRFTLL